VSDVVRSGFTSEPFGSWLGKNRWADQTLTYSFPDEGRFFAYQVPGNVKPLSEQQKQAARDVLDSISSLTGLALREVTESDRTEATLRFAREDGLIGGYAYLPDTDPSGGDGFFGKAALNPVPGGEDYLFFLHEIGHSFGLDHGHEASDFAGSRLNSQEFTLMTYTDYVGDRATESLDTGPVDWAQSFMQLDIAALQFLYGANYASQGEIWSGRTVYSFDPDTGEMSINGVGQGAPEGNRIFRTIWDGNGRDTYDLRAYESDLKVSLAPGAFSTFATGQLADLNRFRDDASFLARGNIANARLVDGDRRALIENARGGAGDDEIAGNGRANRLTGGQGDDRLEGLGRADRLFGGRGDDWLAGGKGGDRLTGGAGADSFVYHHVSDAPTGGRAEQVLDFAVGRDRLDFSALSEGDLTVFGASAFHAGQAGVRMLRRDGDTVVRVDADGDGRGDMVIWLRDTVGLGADDFVL
jgi:serralysin